MRGALRAATFVFLLIAGVLIVVGGNFAIGNADESNMTFVGLAIGAFVLAGVLAAVIKATGGSD